MKGPALSVPAKRTSGWVAETDPKYARAWLEALPLTNSGEAAREIYQALYTINRLSLPVKQRVELMDLYQKPVTAVSSALQGHLNRATQPLGPKKRQLAEFVRRLHIEMAHGYKCCLQDLSGARFGWGRGMLLARVAERALYYSREVLIRSYLVYIPYPAGIWKDINEIYRFAETCGMAADRIELQTDAGNRRVTITERYLQTLLLGVSQPYQLPPSGCLQLCAFLEEWGGRARLEPSGAIANPVGHFVVDLAADAPPLAYPRDRPIAADEALRVLNAMDPVAIAHGFIGRLQKGEPVTSLAVGVDCLEETCLDLLQRIVSVWGLTPRRRFNRIRRNSYVSVCSGMPALYFFTNNQTPFAPFGADSADSINTSPTLPPVEDILFEPEQSKPESIGGRAWPGKARTRRTASSTFRVDRWHVRDTGPQGMLLARYGEMALSVRVGDLLGLREADGMRWSAAVVRWLRSPESQSLELGVELLAPAATAVAVRGAAEDTPYVEALLLPATAAPRRPATLLVARGTAIVGRNMYLMENGRPARLVRSLKVLERTVAYERVVFADVTVEA